MVLVFFQTGMVIPLTRKIIYIRVERGKFSFLIIRISRAYSEGRHGSTRICTLLRFFCVRMLC